MTSRVNGNEPKSTDSEEDALIAIPSRLCQAHLSVNHPIFKALYYCTRVSAKYEHFFIWFCCKWFLFVLSEKYHS